MEDNEEIEFVAPEHDRLVNALSKLDKTQHIHEPTRSEPTNLNSEFNLIKRSNKLNINNVVKVLEETAHNVQVGKQLKKTQVSTKVLPKPLEKPQAERVKRATGYEETKKIVGRWDPVVARSRTVDFVSFPLKVVIPKLQPTGEFLSKLVLKSPLEKQLEEVDPHAEAEEEEEEEKAYPMSYEEMVEHRQHLAKIRARQSYTAAKAKRQSKIKSKKFHRILKKEKLKSQLKEFEELQKKDPEEALKKLEALEKARALERHTLRHKNTGKWAKNKLVRAKYDKEVRQQLAEQLSVSKNLTHKTQQIDSTDDEANEDQGIPDVTLSQDPMNPWMMTRADKSNVDEEFNFGYKKYVQERMLKRKADSDSDSENSVAEKDEEEVDMSLLKNGISKIQKQFIKPDEKCEVEPKPKIETKKSQLNNSVKIKKKEFNIKSSKKSQDKNKKPRLVAVATTNWNVDIIEDNKTPEKQLISSKKVNHKGNDVSRIASKAKDVTNAFDTLESETSRKINQKLKKLRNDLNQLEKKSMTVEHKKSKNKNEENSLEYLSFKNKKLRPAIDEPLMESASKTIEDKPQQPSSSNISKDILKSAANNDLKISSDIDPTKFIEVQPKYLNTAVGEAALHLDDLDDEEQVVPKVNIEDVFEEDDVVASFRQEKEDEVNKDKPQDIDLTLPGWGAWGGKGIKPVKRRKNRFIVKAPPKTTRRDENKGDIIIKEYKDPKLAVHKVTDVPFPFTSVKDYEASIRAPLGSSFIPENAHQKLIKPSVITKAGAIIEPMDEEELLIKKNRTFKNQSIIKLLGHN